MGGHKELCLLQKVLLMHLVVMNADIMAPITSKALVWQTSLRVSTQTKEAQARAQQPEGELTTVDSVLSLKGTGRFKRHNAPGEWDWGYRPGAWKLLINPEMMRALARSARHKVNNAGKLEKCMFFNRFHHSSSEPPERLPPPSSSTCTYVPRSLSCEPSWIDTAALKA